MDLFFGLYKHNPFSSREITEFCGAAAAVRADLERMEGARQLSSTNSNSNPRHLDTVEGGRGMHST